jgi:predicted acetyltransferase
MCVWRDRRGLGYGKEALAFALTELRRMGERRVLLTTDTDNVAANAIIHANGGGRESAGHDARRDRAFHRCWIDLKGPQEPAGPPAAHERSRGTPGGKT